MNFPDFCITERMKTAAEKMLMVYKVPNNQSLIHQFDSKLTSYFDARQQFIQSAFNANPEFSAFASRPSPVTGVSEIFRLDAEQREEAGKIFNYQLNQIIENALNDMKKNGIFDEIMFDGDREFYGLGKPPLGAPFESQFTRQVNASALTNG